MLNQHELHAGNQLRFPSKSIEISETPQIYEVRREFAAITIPPFTPEVLWGGRKSKLMFFSKRVLQCQSCDWTDVLVKDAFLLLFLSVELKKKSLKI